MKKLIALLLTTTMLTACGWHLRGSIALPEDLNSIYLSAEDTHGSLINDMQRALISNNISVTKSAAEANYSIKLLGERSERRAASIGGDALASEYELTMEVDYSIDRGEETLLEKDTARTIRTYDYNRNQVLGSSGEEDIIKAEMRNELIQQIVRRLRFLATAPATPAEADSTEAANSKDSSEENSDSEAADGQTAS
jgi:LPS-assembly lipoprotein